MLTMTVTRQGTAGRLEVGGQLRIDHAQQAKAALLEAVAGHPALEIDLSGVEAIDAAGLQLLILAKNEARTAGHSLHLSNHSAPVVELFELYRLAGHFGDPLVLPVSTDGEVA